MTLLSFVTAADIQQELADAVRAKRKQQKLSRRALAEISTVPEATIKKFETTAQISLRQFLLLWQSIADLRDLQTLTRQLEQKSGAGQPRTIDDVLRG